MTHETKNENAFSKKRGALEKIVLHLLKPTSYPMPKMSVEDCLSLLTDSATSTLTRSILTKHEQSGLNKLKTELIKVGIRNMSDVIGSK